MNFDKSFNQCGQGELDSKSSTHIGQEKFRFWALKLPNSCLVLIELAHDVPSVRLCLDAETVVFG